MTHIQEMFLQLIYLLIELRISPVA